MSIFDTLRLMTEIALIVIGIPLATALGIIVIWVWFISILIALFGKPSRPGDHN